MPVSGNLYYSFHPDKNSEKPPVVLIHGAGSINLSWPSEIRRLLGYNVYAVDLPGHGKSEKCDGQQTIGDYARYFVQWLESIHLRRANSRAFIGSVGLFWCSPLAVRKGHFAPLSLEEQPPQEGASCPVKRVLRGLLVV